MIRKLGIRYVIGPRLVELAKEEGIFSKGTKPSVKVESLWNKYLVRIGKHWK